MVKNAEKRNKNLTSPVVRWMEASHGTEGFTDSLRKLLMYACVEWIRRGTSALLTPEEALSKIVCCALPEFPVGEWSGNPEKYMDEIADFCENAKILPLPAALQGELARGQVSPECRPFENRHVGVSGGENVKNLAR